MSENLEIYDLNSNLLGIQDRWEFYKDIKKEFIEEGKVSRKVKTIRFLLMNSSGRIYIQKRSKIKSENPSLYDKTVGGHVSAWDGFDLTAIRECAEELWFPIAVLDQEDFDKAIKTTDLHIIGLGKRIFYDQNFESIRITKEGEKFIQPFMNVFYVGYYDGAIKFCDGESSGIEVFSFDEIVVEIANNPDRFTHDLKIMIDLYKDFLKPIIV